MAECVESILGQSFEDFELIVTDNGSTDRTQALCESFAARDSRVRYLRHERNRGAAWNYNEAVRQAVGRYFKWAPHDDACHPDFLARTVERMEGSPEVAVCYSRTTIIGGDGEVLSNYSDGLHLVDERPHLRLRNYLRRNFLRATGMCNPVLGLIRLSALRQTSLIAPFVASDLSLLAQLAILGKFWELDEPLFRRRVHKGTSTRANRDASSRQAWFDGMSGRSSRSVLAQLVDRRFAVRYRQVRSILQSLRHFDIPEDDRRSCYLEIVRSLVTDPKWVYIDLKYTFEGTSQPGIPREWFT